MVRQIEDDHSLEEISHSQVSQSSRVFAPSDGTLLDLVNDGVDLFQLVSRMEHVAHGERVLWVLLQTLGEEFLSFFILLSVESTHALFQLLRVSLSGQRLHQHGYCQYT